MKTLQELYENGLTTLSLKSSITRSFLSKEEIKSMSEDFKELFNLMNLKKYSIINSLKSGRSFYFQGKKIDVSSLNFLVK